MTSMTIVLMPVARFELMFVTPTFANIAVNEAKIAESIA